MDPTPRERLPSTDADVAEAYRCVAPKPLLAELAERGGDTG